MGLFISNTFVRNSCRVGTWQLQQIFPLSSAHGKQSLEHVSSFSPAMFHNTNSTAARTTTSIKKITIARTRMLATPDNFTAIS